MIVGVSDRDEQIRRTAEFLQIPESYALEIIAIETGESDGDVVRVFRAQERGLCPERG